MTRSKAEALAEQRLQELREKCYYSLWHFAQVVEPHRVYGECHKELFEFWQHSETMGVDNTLALMPRDHQKSHMLAVRCAWEIYRNPAITIIYVSATSNLAERQLLDIQNILESERFTKLSPTMVNREKGKRAMWNTAAFSVDHPKRLEEGVRDPTVSACGLTTNNCGWHCKFLAKDDVVVPDNAYTSDARKKVEAGCSQLASVLTTGGVECAVGTRYHPRDHYNTLKNMSENVHDEETGEVLDTQKVYSVHERQVELDGVFLWPRSPRKSDGVMFGFDWTQLARKKAKYTEDILQFFAQYYNNPNDMDNQGIERNTFQYYNRELVTNRRGSWYIKDTQLKLFASMDFAYSLNADADYTVIMVVGVDWEFNVYVLDIIRFKTKRIPVYFDNLKAAMVKWEFTQLYAEVTAAQAVIVQALKEEIAREGLRCRVNDNRPTRNDGRKAERIEAALSYRYREGKVFHYKGGLCSLLEEELILDNPPHDDIKDALAAVLSDPKISKPRRPSEADEDTLMYDVQYNSRFGGCV